LIDPDGPNKVPPKRVVAPGYSAIANVAHLPEVVVPAGLTTDKLPVTISFLGLAYSEPKILAYGYAYEQATHRRVSPSTTPALPGEKFDY
jgi:amidase